MIFQFEELYQLYKEELTNSLTLADKLTLWKEAQNSLDTNDRFKKQALIQYLNDRAIDNLNPDEAYQHTKQLCWRAQL